MSNHHHLCLLSLVLAATACVELELEPDEVALETGTVSPAPPAPAPCDPGPLDCERISINANPPGKCLFMASNNIDVQSVETGRGCYQYEPGVASDGDGDGHDDTCTWVYRGVPHTLDVTVTVSDDCGAPGGSQ